MIHKLVLTNFKNFRQAELPLGWLTLIVGTNAAGKSNIRDAFRFIHGMSRGYSLPEIIGEKWIEGGSLQWKGIRGGVREAAFAGEQRFAIQTSASLDPTRSVRPDGQVVINKNIVGIHEIEVDVGKGRKPPRITRECMTSTKDTFFDSSPAKDPVTQTDEKFLFVRLPRGGKNRKSGKKLQFPSSQPVLSQIVEHQDATIATNGATRRMLRVLRSMRFLDLAPEAMRQPSIPGQEILGDRGENLSSVLLAICDDIRLKQAVLEWVRQLTPLDVKDFEFNADQTGKVLVSLVESDGRKTSAYSASDGTLRFLAMIAALYGPQPASFYFFEEIDNGIHPTRLYLLLQLIEQRVARGDVQVVATTHSPQLLGFLSDESRQSAALVYRLEGHPEGRIKRIIDIPQAPEVMEQRNLSRLHESGWLENAVEFLEGGEGEE